MSDDIDESQIRNDGYSNGMPRGDRRRPRAPAPMTPNPLSPEKIAEIERVVAKLRADGRLPRAPQGKR